MGKYCIFCDSQEKSGEHVFPSVFGGRLENKKIYCRKHNSDLGHYVGILDESIGALNNIFGVNPDRGQAKSVEFIDYETGEKYLRKNNGDITYSVLGNLDEEAMLNGKPMTVKVSSEKDIAILEKYLESRGIKISSLQRGEVKRSLFKNDLSVNIRFGNIDFFKATLYLLITFLAHYDKPIIELIDLERVKKILIEESLNEEVFNMVALEDFPDYLKGNQQIGHTFAFVKNKNILYGILSYFNSVTYVVKIGELLESFNNFVVYVNPLGTSCDPNDDMVKEKLSSDIEVKFTPELHRLRIKSIIENSEGSPIDVLSKKIGLFTMKRQNEKLISDLKKCISLDQHKQFWSENKQTIYNVISYLAEKDPGKDEQIIMVINYIKYLVDLYKEDFLSEYKEFLDDGCIDEKMFKLLDIETLIEGTIIELSEYYFNHPSCIDDMVFDDICKKALYVAFNMTEDYWVLIEELRKNKILI